MLFNTLCISLLMAADISIGIPMKLENTEIVKLSENETPVTKLLEAEVDLHHPFLYKIISVQDWENSQQEKKLALSPMDNKFIHLATANQIDRIIEKYWHNESRFAILKIQTNKLQGKLIFEKNPNGATRYFHLYDGYIPFDSIIDGKLVVRRNLPAEQK